MNTDERGFSVSLTERVLDAVFEVSNTLGVGFLESCGLWGPEIYRWLAPLDPADDRAFEVRVRRKAGLTPVATIVPAPPRVVCASRWEYAFANGGRRPLKLSV
jgi:hypothetical protein